LRSQIEYQDGDIEEGVELPEATVFVYQEGEEGGEEDGEGAGEATTPGKRRGRGPGKVKKEGSVVKKRGPGRPARAVKAPEEAPPRKRAKSTTDKTTTTSKDNGAPKKQAALRGCGAGFKRGGQGVIRYSIAL
jgi:hypothetical protein